MDTENKSLLLPPGRNRLPHFSLSREAGYANGAKDLTWLDTNIPCQAACPAHTRIPDYLDEINQGNYDEAYLINLVDNVFPGVLGRVCSRPCEDVCRHGREGLGEPVAICFSKRAASDLGTRAPVVLKPAYPPTGKTVAVIGGGPAGLAAARELALFGHTVAVYEKYAEAGGMMNQGIPEFRLPRAIIRKEIQQIELLGVTILCNQNVGTDITVSSLLDSNDAVIVAAGTLDPNIVDIPGKDLNGILHGLEFLLEANEKGTAELGKRVIVIGGGFTAMDCARTALRLNSDVAIYYRRSKEEMAIPADELAEVQHENIPLELMAGPMGYNGDPNIGIESMRFVRNELGAPDDSGRRRPVPISGSEFEVAVDTVLLATGQWQDTSWLGPDVAKYVLDEDGWIERGRPVHTQHPALFLAGDYSIGASTLIDAIGHAKTCAREVDEFLVGERRVMDVAQIENAYETGRSHDLDAIVRQKNPTLPLEARSFKAEVETGFDRARATVESSRCYLCHFKFEIDNDICIYCEKCLEVKPQENCIVRIDDLTYDDEGRITGYVDAIDLTPHVYPLLYINQDECIRCGECEKVCPVECISIQKVTRHSERVCDLATQAAD